MMTLNYSAGMHASKSSCNNIDNFHINCITCITCTFAVKAFPVYMNPSTLSPPGKTILMWEQSMAPITVGNLSHKWLLGICSFIIWKPNKTGIFFWPGCLALVDLCYRQHVWLGRLARSWFISIIWITSVPCLDI